MTKRNLLLVSLLLVGLGTASSLFAQVTGIVFGGSNNTNNYIRKEGDAEGIGTISLTTRSTGTIKAGSAWYITYNAPLAQAGTTFGVSVSCSGDFAGAICDDLTMAVNTALFSSSPSVPVQGPLTNNQVILTFTSDVYLGAPTNGTQINIAVRVMAQGLPYGYGVYATVRAYYQYAQYPMTVNPLYPAPYLLAVVASTQALTTIVGDYSWWQGAFVPGPEYVLTCIGVKKIKGTSYDNDFELLIKENWENALTSLSDEEFLEEYPPPGPYDVSSGTFADAPSAGSNILITLFHIPPGVTVDGRTPYPCEDFDTSSPNYCTNGNLSIEAPTPGAMTSGSDGLGVQSFWYQVDSTNLAVIESANFGFKLSADGPLLPNQNYQITAQVSLTDENPSAAPAEMPNFTYPETPIISVVEFKDCVTKLLFPYVNAYQGGTSAFSSFGTGINVANTTVDPFALPYSAQNCPTSIDDGSGLCYPDEARGSAVPQSGSCTFYFYPADESTMAVFTTPIISVGGSYAFDVGGNAATFQGKTGYAIAVCNFQNAHGFAEIYDNYVNLATSGPTATLGYLADVLPDPAFYPRSPAGDGLGETAIAPININRFILEWLMAPHFH